MDEQELKKLIIEELLEKDGSIIEVSIPGIEEVDKNTFRIELIMIERAAGDVEVDVKDGHIVIDWATWERYK